MKHHMRRRRLCVLAWMILAPLFSPAAPSGRFAAHAAEVAEGLMSEIKGDMEVKKRGGKEWIAAYEGMRIAPGDQISAGIDGHGLLTLQESKTEILPLTQFVVGRCVVGDKENYTELFLEVGKVSSRVDPNRSKSARFNVITPTTVAGVRGTRMTISHFPGVGTNVQITEGRGFVSIASPQTLPPAALSLLGISGDKKEKSEKEGKEEKESKEDKKEKEAKTEDGKMEKDPTDIGATPEAAEEKREDALTGGDATPGTEEEKGEDVLTDDDATPEAAVEIFNRFLDESDQMVAVGDESEKLELLDDKTFDYVIEVEDGQRITVGDDAAADPASVVTPSMTQEMDAQTVTSPEGLSSVELEVTATSAETSDAPESVIVGEEQSTFSEANNIATSTSTELGGIPPSSKLEPPAFPDRTGKTNLTNSPGH